MGKHSSDDDSSDDKNKRILSSEDSDDLSSEDESRSRKKSKKSKHSSSHKKKGKDKKKHKKKSRKHRKRSSSSASSEDDDGGSENEWVVKQPQVASSLKPQPPEDKLSEDKPLKKPKIDDLPSRVPTTQDEDEWASFGSSFQTFSNESKKTERKKQKELERESSSIDKPGQSINELNPYWKDGGTGLPSQESSSSSTSTKPNESQVIGDGGLNYLRKAFIRAKEQAKEEGRNVGEIISERWGSLERFLVMLEEAEKKVEQLSSSRSSSRDDDRKRFKRPNKDSDDEQEVDRNRRQSDYSSRHHHHQRSRHDRDRDRDRRRRSSSSREKNQNKDRDSRSSGWRKKRDSPERSAPSKKSFEVKDDKNKYSKPSSSSVKGNEPDTSSFPSSAKIRALETKKDSPVRSMQNSDDEEDDEKVVEAPKVLTDKEMNELNAKLMKAEMLGNTSLAQELKNKISEADAARKDFIKNGGDINKPQGSSTKVVTKVLMESSRGGGRKKDKITETHKDGQRVRYFPDDDRQSLQNMFQREKMNTAADENALFARLAGKGAKTGQDYDIDDVFADKASSSKQSSKEQEREVRDALDQEKQYKKILDNCPWCFDGSVVEKHLILSVAEKCYLCAPPYQSLTEGHCLIVPMAHASSATELDEDIWAEMQKFRKSLVQMFRQSDQDMVIFETALFLKRHPHMYLECIPMPKETGELAPIYFKKAIQECETEWAQNKKLVELRNRDVRRAIPKGLPYFSVDFGDDSCGFAHVVEDEQNFPRNFAHEIVGGMMELDHHLWRKQKKDDFKTQRTKVMEFLKEWAPFDWTRDSN